MIDAKLQFSFVPSNSLISVVEEYCSLAADFSFMKAIVKRADLQLAAEVKLIQLPGSHLWPS